MTKTKIEWADEVWNPVTGCTKVSEGCRNCYAERIANRFWGERKFTNVQLHPEKLEEPLHWKKPRRVFVNSMSDLFHPKVTFEFVDQVIYNAAKAWCFSQSIFMILTKRPERMLEWEARKNMPVAMPLKGIWMGVSVETQKEAEQRVPLLLKMPANLRFISAEPLLGPVNFRSWFNSFQPMPWTTRAYPAIHWVICGGESGPGARPMHPEWARSLRDQCQAAGVPFFFKQWGEWAPAEQGSVPQVQPGTQVQHWGFPALSLRVGKKAAGRLLDGQEWNEEPTS